MAHYEIHARRYRKWVLDSIFDDKELAVAAAVLLLNGKLFDAVRVVEEIRDPDGRKTVNVVFKMAARATTMASSRPPKAAATAPPGRRPKAAARSRTPGVLPKTMFYLSLLGGLLLAGLAAWVFLQDWIARR